MTPKTYIKIDSRAMRELSDAINKTKNFHSKYVESGDRDIDIFGENGYVAIPQDQITSIVIGKTTISIDTEYLALSIWREVNSYHLTVYPARLIDKDAIKTRPVAFRKYHTSHVAKTCPICSKTFKNAHGLNLHDYYMHRDKTKQETLPHDKN